jgi:hypothetical protein
MIPLTQAIVLGANALMILAGVFVAFQSRVIHIPEFNDRVILGYAI